MRDHPSMQVRDRAPPVGGEQEWQDGVNEAGEAGLDEPEAEGHGDAEMPDVRFADRRRMFAKIVQQLVHEPNCERRARENTADFAYRGGPQ